MVVFGFQDMNNVSHSEHIDPDGRGDSPSTSAGPENTYRIRSVEKAFKILELLDEHRPTLTVPDIVESTGMNRVTAYRFCRTLEALGYLEALGERSFRPGPKALLLGHAAMRTHELPQLARPHLEELRDETGETANMAVRHDTEIVYLVRLRTSHFISIQLFEGSRLPAHSSSMGKAMLAFLPADELEHVLSRISFERFTAKTVENAAALRRQLEAVRRTGYALNDEELALGLRGVAAPIFDHQSYPIAAINVAVARPIADREVKERLVPAVLRTAERISEVASLVSPREEPEGSTGMAT
jgi:IclR family pca regulon transcriptional regulator